MTAALQTIDEIRLLAGRSLRHIPRIPEKAFGAVILPVVFVVLFSYVFGSAISIPGGDYHAYLVSGIFAQSMMGTLPGIAVGVASDIRSGLMDRLRTLPIARGSVIAGRTIAEMVELARRHRRRRGLRPDRRLGAARQRARDRRGLRPPAARRRSRSRGPAPTSACWCATPTAPTASRWRSSSR